MKAAKKGFPISRIGVAIPRPKPTMFNVNAVLLALLMAVAIPGVEFYVGRIELTDGRVFEEARIHRMHPDGVEITDIAGKVLAVVPLDKLSPDLQKKYGADGALVRDIPEIVDGAYETDAQGGLLAAGEFLKLQDGRFSWQTFGDTQPSPPTVRGRFTRKGPWIIFDHPDRDPLRFTVVRGKLMLIDGFEAQRWFGEGSPPSASLVPEGQSSTTLTPKVNATILPRMEFNDATLTEAIRAIAAKTKQLDAEGTGISLIGFNLEKCEVRITADFRNERCSDVLKRVAEATGYVFRQDAYASVICPSGHRAIADSAQAKEAEAVANLPVPVTLENATIQHGVEALRVALAKDKDPRSKQTKIVFLPAAQEAAGSNEQRITAYSHVPVIEFCRYLCENTRCFVRIRKDEVIIDARERR